MREGSIFDKPAGSYLHAFFGRLGRFFGRAKSQELGQLATSESVRAENSRQQHARADGAADVPHPALRPLADKGLLQRSLKPPRKQRKTEATWQTTP